MRTTPIRSLSSKVLLAARQDDTAWCTHHVTHHQFQHIQIACAATISHARISTQPTPLRPIFQRQQWSIKGVQINFFSDRVWAYFSLRGKKSFSTRERSNLDRDHWRAVKLKYYIVFRSQRLGFDPGSVGLEYMHTSYRWVFMFRRIPCMYPHTEDMQESQWKFHKKIL